jgi:hypothetical protein
MQIRTKGVWFHYVSNPSVGGGGYEAKRLAWQSLVLLSHYKNAGIRVQNTADKNPIEDSFNAEHFLNYPCSI